MSNSTASAQRPGLADELAIAAYNQNFETFRSLNGLMWQIPLIAMTLTGGLWFGVTSVDGAAEFRVCLLALAGVGNIGLVAILHRLRYIMGCYLEWLEATNASGHVAAPGKSFFTRGRRMKQVVQLLLLVAAAMSFGLIYLTLHKAQEPEEPMLTASAWYDAHAEQLADGYESIDSRTVHPELFEFLDAAGPLRILDVGAGTGRDASAMAALGHQVVAIDPSSRMLQLARTLHPLAEVTWLNDQLPSLEAAEGRFDLILLSAVWMHVPPDQRQAAFSRLVTLLAPGGTIFATLRTGPDDHQRGMFAVQPGALERLAASASLSYRELGSRMDLLGREDVMWQTVSIGDLPNPGATPSRTP